MRTALLGFCVALVSFGPRSVEADVWDMSGAAADRNDDTPSTHNELIHGSDQLHDLGARPGIDELVPDQDWYSINSKARASYEVVVDATAGDIGQPLVQLYNSDGTVLLGTGTAVGNGFSVSLRWQNTSSVAVDHRIRITSGLCTTDCGSDDVYRIRAYETTCAVARFNNVDPQVTVFLLQNSATYSITSPHVYLWSATGALLADYVLPPPGTLGPKAMLNLNTAALAPGVGGSITVSHLARYGDLVGKATSMEAPNGLAFDTPMVSRPH